MAQIGQEALLANDDVMRSFQMMGRGLVEVFFIQDEDGTREVAETYE